jgi:hypothetical protein
MIRMGCLSEKFIDLMIKSTSKSTFTLLKLAYKVESFIHQNPKEKKKNTLFFPHMHFIFFVNLESEKILDFTKIKVSTLKIPKKEKKKNMFSCTPTIKVPPSQF